MVCFCSIETQTQFNAKPMSYRQLYPHSKPSYKQFQSKSFRIYMYQCTLRITWHIKMNIQLQSQCMHTFSYHVCCHYNFISKYLRTIKCNDYATTISFMLTNSFFLTKLASAIFFVKNEICINFNGKHIGNQFQFGLKIFT